MRYLTAAGVGVLTAIVTAVLWIVIGFVLPLAVPILFSRIGAARYGSGGIGAVSSSIGFGSILLAALVGFAGGVAWMLWRRQA